MTLRHAIVLGLALGLVRAPQSLVAQAPSIDSSATAFRRLLPVFDDYGQVISEDTISATMRPARDHKWILAYALIGAVVFHAIRPTAPNGADCSIYEPCTAREEFYNTTAWFAGGVVGLMLGYGAISAKSIERAEAVEILRARRRAEHQAMPPP